MVAFRPTRAPAGRLARLGVVLDPDDRAVSLAGLCDRAGIGIVWLADRAGLVSGDHDRSVVPIADRLAAGLDRASVGLSLATIGELQQVLESAALASLLRDDRLEASWPVAPTDPTTDMGDLRPRRSVVVSDLDDVSTALGFADDIILAAWRFADLETAGDEVRAECLEAGRDPATLGVTALLPVSIGRTQAEAVARVTADSVFELVGDPAQTGIFGTLEECQDRVIALAHAGFTGLHCVVPATPDIHDVIAQLTAINLGTTDVLIPGSLRSPSPPPPDGWGGRSPVPDRPRVSGGSRRR